MKDVALRIVNIILLILAMALTSLLWFDLKTSIFFIPEIVFICYLGMIIASVYTKSELSKGMRIALIMNIVVIVIAFFVLIVALSAAIGNSSGMGAGFAGLAIFMMVYGLTTILLAISAAIFFSTADFIKRK